MPTIMSAKPAEEAERRRSIVAQVVIIVEDGRVTDVLADSKDCSVEIIDLDDQDFERRKESLKAAEAYRNSLLSV